MAPINTLQKIDDTGDFVIETNTDIPLKDGLCRCNVYRPHDSGNGAKYPVLMTYGPCKYIPNDRDDANHRWKGHSIL